MKDIGKSIIIVGLASLSLYGGLHGGNGVGWGILAFLTWFFY